MQSLGDRQWGFWFILVICARSLREECPVIRAPSAVVSLPDWFASFPHTLLLLLWYRAHWCTALRPCYGGCSPRFILSTPAPPVAHRFVIKSPHDLFLVFNWHGGRRRRIRTSRAAPWWLLFWELNSTRWHTHVPLQFIDLHSVRWPVGALSKCVKRIWVSWFVVNLRIVVRSVVDRISVNFAASVAWSLVATWRGLILE